MPDLTVPLLALVATLVTVVGGIVTWAIVQNKGFVDETRERVGRLEKQHEADEKRHEQDIRDGQERDRKLTEAEDKLDDAQSSLAGAQTALEQQKRANTSLINQHSDELEALKQSHLAAIAAAVANLKQTLSSEHEANVQRLKVQLEADYEQKYKPLRDDFDTLKRQLEAKDSELSAEKQKNGSLEHQVEEMQGQIDTLKKRVEELEKKPTGELPALVITEPPTASAAEPRAGETGQNGGASGEGAT